MKKIFFAILLSGCLNTHSGNPKQQGHGMCGTPVAECTTASVSTITSRTELMPPCSPNGCTDLQNHIHSRPLTEDDYHLPPVRKSEKF